MSKSHIFVCFHLIDASKPEILTKHPRNSPKLRSIYYKNYKSCYGLEWARIQIPNPVDVRIRSQGAYCALALAHLDTLMDDRYLAGDIGGTKTILALFSPENGPHRPLVEKTYPSNDYATLEEIVCDFLREDPHGVSGASIGVAGPVIGGRSQVTNLRWVVDAVNLSRVLDGAPVNLLNDLEAIAAGIPHMYPEDLATLIPGEPQVHGTIGVIAPGTGLGEGFLVWTGERYRSYPSEGGHSSFGPETPLELELLNYLWPTFDHVSYERVCSGLGMINLYKFLRDGKGLEEPAWLKDALAGTNDPTPVIARAAMAGKAEICTKTLELFVSILGSEAGNLALKVLATGGIYLGGGIPPRILPFLEVENFRRSLVDKGRFADVLTRVPVYVILHRHAGLFGAACHELMSR
jgi:glucokinase